MFLSQKYLLSHLHKDLFYLAEQNIKRIDIKDLKKYENLLKLHDKAEIINSLES